MKYTKEKQSTLLKLYLIISIILSIIAIISDFIFFKFGISSSLVIVSGFINFGLCLYFIFSIYALIKFIKKKFHKITFLIPSIEIILFILFFLIASPNTIVDMNLFYQVFRYFDFMLSNFLGLVVAPYLLYLFRK